MTSLTFKILNFTMTLLILILISWASICSVLFVIYIVPWILGVVLTFFLYDYYSTTLRPNQKLWLAKLLDKNYDSKTKTNS